MASAFAAIRAMPLVRPRKRNGENRAVKRQGMFLKYYGGI